jgi:hypothetical protein
MARGPIGPELVADCSRCFGLCCVLLPFSASAGFGVDKAGGTPCTHLAADDGCDIHATLREDGWPGCAAFDCFGAGQQVSQVTYAGRSWREGTDRGEMAAVLSVMRMLHEMLAHLAEAVRRSGAGAELGAEVLGLVDGTPEQLLALDLDELRGRVGARLRAVSAGLRANGPRPGDDLAGRDLRGRELRAADLRGSVLIGTDLRGVDLSLADVLGADLRGADVRGARLADALFLTQAQVNTARGDGDTTLPDGLRRPGHWA